MGGALDGVKVVEFSRYVTGPYASMLLADMGAEVIKVETRPGGDPFRGWGGPGGYTPTFSSLNRRKKSIAVNIRDKAGQDVLRRLIESADVFIENFRPGVMDKMGVGYDVMHEANPGLIYCSISGFGQTGPYRDWPGYDTIGQAMSGLMSLLTDPEDPKPMGYSLSDHLTGFFACYGVLSALYSREKTGKGQMVETSLLQATTSFIQEMAATHLASGDIPRRDTRVHNAQVYAFKAGDGKPFVIHLSSPPKFWQGLTVAVGMPELQEDERFKERPGRQKGYDVLHGILAEVFAKDDRDVWVQKLRDNDVPCSPMYNLKEVFEDPQVQHLGMPIEVEHPTQGKVRLAGSPVNLSETPATFDLGAPVLGEHTDELLTGLGYSQAEIDEMRSQEVLEP
jgi:crotonobetainyl-CoA:carnitine CoA-transferase CaiB-like acyl-CoA transferase